MVLAALPEQGRSQFMYAVNKELCHFINKAWLGLFNKKPINDSVCDKNQQT